MTRRTDNDHGKESCPRSPSPLIVYNNNNDEHPMYNEKSNNSDTDSDTDSDSEHVS